MSEIKGRAIQVVAYIKSSGPDSATGIASGTGIARSSISRVCNELAARGVLIKVEATKPITYHLAHGVAIPEWVAPAKGTGIEPMCKALYEAARRELKLNQGRAILGDPHYIAAEGIWG